MNDASVESPVPELMRGLAPRRRDAADAAGGRGEEEVVLLGLLREEQPILEQLGVAKAKLTAGILESLNDPRRALLVARVLREVTATSNAISKRQQGVASALAALRAQRQMLALHRGERDGV